MIGQLIDLWQSTRAMRSEPPYLKGAEVIRVAAGWPSIVFDQSGRVHHLDGRPPWRPHVPR